MAKNNSNNYVKIFHNTEEINEYCTNNSCEPLSITPLAVRNDYKALGSTSRTTTVITTYDYAVILKPIISDLGAPGATIDTRISKLKHLKKLLNNVNQKAISDALHYSQHQILNSRNWFTQHPDDKPLWAYAEFMELADWQIDTLLCMIDACA